MDIKQSIKFKPGSDEYLTLLMAPWHLNLMTGKDRADLLAWGRLIWETAYMSGAVQAPEPTREVLLGLVREISPEGIEEACEECGGDTNQCAATCCYRRAHDLLAVVPG